MAAACEGSSSASQESGFSRMCEACQSSLPQNGFLVSTVSVNKVKCSVCLEGLKEVKFDLLKHKCIEIINDEMLGSCKELRIALTPCRRFLEKRLELSEKYKIQPLLDMLLNVHESIKMALNISNALFHNWDGILMIANAFENDSRQARGQIVIDWIIGFINDFNVDITKGLLLYIQSSSVDMKSTYDVLKDVLGHLEKSTSLIYEQKVKLRIS